MADYDFCSRHAGPTTLDYEAALSLMCVSAHSIGAEIVSLADASGRILAAPIKALLNNPPVDVSAMDGYAVGPVDSFCLNFRLIGKAFPGIPSPAVVSPGFAVQVFTGAPIPKGADRVIVQESVKCEADVIIASALPVADRHIRRCGSDFASGDVLLDPGRVLDFRAISVVAASGVKSVPVARRPRVFIIATGNELLACAEVITDRFAIPDSLSLAVAVFATNWGAQVVGTACLPDQSDEISQCVRQAIALADIVVMIGGASVGERDLCKGAVHALGGEQTFSKIAMKPGKPVWHSLVGEVQVLGLPGNPTAALTTARLLLAPLICLLTGRSASVALQWRWATLSQAITATGDRETFYCGTWDGDTVRVADRQFSSSQAALANANVLIRSAPGAGAAPCGAPVTMIDF